MASSPFLEFYADNPAVAHENSFRRARPNTSAPPSFADARPRLPQPFWDGHGAAIRCYWKAWELAFGNLQRVTAANGFIEPFIDSAFNSCLFMWDSVFTLLFARYGRGAFDFQRTLDNLYSKQHADGFISREIHESDGRDQFHRYDPVSTGPNVLAWCEWENFVNFGDRARLGRVYPVLLAYHEWLRRFRTWPDGSYMSCGLACGMDNQPRVLPGQHAFMDHAWSAWIDATSQAALSARLLGAMAAVLGRAGEPAAAACRAEASALAAYVNERMWDEGRGVYADRRLRAAPGTELSASGSVASFWPLLAGLVPPARVPRLVAHLDDPAAFNRPVRPPALSARDPAYEPRGGYWNGGVWPPTAYMVLRGLTAVGQDDIAADIGANYHAAVTQVFEDTGTLWENLAPEHAPPRRAVPGEPSKRDFVGWGGLGPVAVLLEYVLGLRPDVLAGTLTWDVRQLERHGVSNYPFGEGVVSLEAGARGAVSEEPAVRVTSTVPLRVLVRWGCSATAVGGVLPPDRAAAAAARRERLIEAVVMPPLFPILRGATAVPAPAASTAPASAAAAVAPDPPLPGGGTAAAAAPIDLIARLSPTALHGIDVPSVPGPLTAHTVGLWTACDGGVVSPRLPRAVLELDAAPPPAGYRLALWAEPLDLGVGPPNALVLPLALGASRFVAVLGLRQPDGVSLSGLEAVHGQDVGSLSNPTRVLGPPPFEAGRRTRVCVDVSAAAVSVAVDGQRLVHWGGGVAALDMQWWWQTPRPCVAVGALDSVFRITGVTLQALAAS